MKYPRQHKCQRLAQGQIPTRIQNSILSFFPICFMDKDYSSSPFLIHAQSKLCNNLHDFLLFCRVGILIFFLFPRSYFFFVLEVLLLLPQLQLRFMFSPFLFVKCINHTSSSFSSLLSVSFSFCSNQARNSFLSLFSVSDQIILSDFVFVEPIIGFLFILCLIEVFFSVLLFGKPVVGFLF